MKKIAVVLADGFEEIEALTCVDVLRRAGFTCDTVSTMGRETVKSSHGIPVIADKLTGHRPCLHKGSFLQTSRFRIMTISYYCDFYIVTIDTFYRNSICASKIFEVNL